MNQDGLKPLNMISLTSGTFSATIPNLIDQTTNQYNASLTYTGEKFFGQLTYYGSYFNNHVQSMTWENAFVPGTFATMSSAPTNEFNQFAPEGRLQLLADDQAGRGCVVRAQYAEPGLSQRSDGLAARHSGVVARRTRRVHAGLRARCPRSR